MHVSRLRSVLEPDRQPGGASMLETVGGGYRLAVAPEASDVARFAREVTSGRELLDTDPAAAGTALAAALDLWRGEAYEEFAYDDFAQQERRRLEEARIAALEDRISADLAVGRSGDLVSEIEALRAGRPLASHLRSGRDASTNPRWLG